MPVYGLVNLATKELITERFGAGAWVDIRNKALVVDDDFVGMQEYPDDVTYRLIGAASEHLNIPSADLLRAFGQYWTRFVARRGYGDLLEVSGNSLPDFLENLDSMHAQIGLLFPALRPPSFRVTDITADSLKLHYFTERQGLSAMVIGLLEGLEAHFNLTITAQQIADRTTGAEHDIFAVSFRPRTDVQTETTRGDHR